MPWYHLGLRPAVWGMGVNALQPDPWVRPQLVDVRPFVEIGIQIELRELSVRWSEALRVRGTRVNLGSVQSVIRGDLDEVQTLRPRGRATL